jgi:putative endonuclease
MSEDSASEAKSEQERENHIQAGRKGENAALAYLLKQGYTLLDRNWRFGRGELDLVMEAPDGDLVFVEVKTRRQHHAGDALEWITPRKQAQIRRVARGYCLRHAFGDHPMRFDAVGVDLSGPGGAPDITHVPHAFIPSGSWF